ncbi:MAG: FGGY-family carbohydrate kinase [Candidatus Hydrogenedentes bacterium]|nr:FGGY-family carbohydrate kinase [Candidatus Hydrogenedentota bacterium]
MLNPSGTILVFDLGTTNFKGTLFDINGELKALVRIPTPFTNTRGMHSEVSVAAFDAAIQQIADELRASAPADYAAITAVTFSSQTNSFVLLAPSGEALTPFIIWNDRRAAAIDPPLDAFITLPDFYARSGVPGLSPEFMLAKLYWHQEETAELWERVDRILLISDYLTWRFTGKFVTEAGTAGLTGLIDIHTLEWRDDALALIALERDSLCDIVRAGTNLGRVTPAASEAFHLSSDCRFVVGCLDQFAGAIGAGNTQCGDISETTGTVLATVRCADEFAPVVGSPVFWGPSASPGRYYQMIFGDVSANLLEAFRNALPEPMEFDALGEEAANASSGRLILPRNLDTPALLELVRAWANMEPRGEAVRAIFEGVANSLSDQLEQLCGPSRPSEIHSVGGAARSKVWMAIKSDILGIPARAVDCPEPTSLGAALLAMHGLSGISLESLAARCVKLAGTE